MIVKIGKQIFDSKDIPIMIVVSEAEQKQIAQIDRKVAPQGKYAHIPDASGWSVDKIKKWMDI